MQSHLALILEKFSGFLERHRFVAQEILERPYSKHFQESIYQSAEFELRIGVDFRGDITVQAKSLRSNDDWYEISVVLEMIADISPFILDDKNVAVLISQMSDNYDELAHFFSHDGSELRGKYGLWLEGSYWGRILKARK